MLAMNVTDTCNPTHDVTRSHMLRVFSVSERVIQKHQPLLRSGLTQLKKSTNNKTPLATQPQLKLEDPKRGKFCPQMYSIISCTFHTCHLKAPHLHARLLSSPFQRTVPQLKSLLAMSIPHENTILRHLELRNLDTIIWGGGDDRRRCVISAQESFYVMTRTFNDQIQKEMCKEFQVSGQQYQGYEK